jgi:hypothetical protein
MHNIRVKWIRLTHVSGLFVTQVLSTLRCGEGSFS